ncbi:HNH endonuclease [Leptospira mtsangambouensis]|uniref:HNH endonuclease n=1 Tax=Leptospira mtsangambouensis TaxID=2484912 RepID=UPI001EEB1059|nr:HNH endonuclease [Leptospira mtsangambouensis]MCG6142733.1 HNH endonuclease [Leptospira mtsangambouensis]
MICIFCQKESTSSKSKEHIVPESLGNTKYTLKPGIVCDQCNNYFARKVEKPFLDHPSVIHLRFDQAIKNKKGLVPSVNGLILPNIPVKLFRNIDEKDISLYIDIDLELTEKIRSQKKGKLIVPINNNPPDNKTISRFIAKIALEAMAQRLEEYNDGINYIASEIQLNAIRRHARYGEITHWPVNIRRIYDADRHFTTKSGREVQTVHEFDILKTDNEEWFFIIAFFGLEFAINYAGPDIEGYQEWLQQHNEISPLYYGKNQNVHKEDD